MLVPPRQGRDGFEDDIAKHTNSVFIAGLLIGTLRFASLSGQSLTSKPGELLVWIFFAFNCVAWYLYVQATKPPTNDPHSFCKAGRSTKPALVFLGDSITHGRISGAFVDMVQKKNPQLAVVNCGQNSILTWSVAKERVKWVAACRPSYVSIMIGANDVRGVYKKDWGNASKKMWKIPEEVSLSNFEKNLRSIIDELIETTDAKLGLNTLCPMGEVMSSKANDCVRQANEIVRKLVESYQNGKSKGRVMLVEVFAPLEKFILASSSEEQRLSSLKVDDFLSVATELALRSRFLGQGLDQIGKRFGLVATCDALHLNESGATVVAGAVQAWLEEVQAAK